MLTHANLVANVAQHTDGERPRMNVSSDSVQFGLLPMYHIYGLSAINLIALRSGATLVSMPRFELELLLQVAEKYQVTKASLVPPIILALAKHPLVTRGRWPSLAAVTSGAAPLGPELHHAFGQRFPHVKLGQGYGLTESSPTILLSRVFMMLPPEEGGVSSAKPGSAGALLPNTEAKIVDTETGRALPKKQKGELCVRGPQVMKGYLNNPEATAHTLDSEGFLHTGDIAYVDDDGDFFIVDRVKELIKYKGFQVPPAELEGILLSHSSVSDAAVVPRADAAAGEVPIAFVVRASSSASDLESLRRLAEELKQHVGRQVAPYKRLHDIIFVDQIPRSAAGKILRKELRARL
eukprot:TRINITY_DN2187_c0_g1_i1.p1 TRINITY_DN2187_c0_g1~~TRINITY_DN2187_c0_g1_i1.p1  ORF type:complete len:351 (-),score=65.03 TRINITY_DN2187_c0_g1_i1:373-1425(-)